MLRLDAEFRVFELTQFLVEEIRLESWPPVANSRKVALHPGCHGRMLGCLDALRSVIALVPNLTVTNPESSEQCCGFGGTFSVSHPTASRGIGLEKLRTLEVSGASEVVSTDWGCMIHLEGLARREGMGLKFSHVADVLAEALG
jgi:L-lactate dehydrogenase complex protein LldE